MRGDGPLIVLIHGITGRSSQWEPAIDELEDGHTLLAPDLLGHGESAKPRGDYSLGAYASAVRDTMVALGHDRATIVGHSLGGGIAMQFAYQFPERCERLVLVSSGGLGREVHPMLRAATLPGSEVVLPLLTHATLLAGGATVGRALGRLGLQAGPDMAELARGFASLGEPEARHAFIQTMRAVLDAGGQRVSALDRLYLAESVPTAADLGRLRPDHPPRARAHRPRGDARQPPGAARRRRPLPAARAPASLFEAARRVHRRDRARGARHVDDSRPAAGGRARRG